MKFLILLTSIVLTLVLSGCTIVIGNPEATTTTPSQPEVTTELPTEPPTEPTTTVASTTVATEPPAPAPTNPPTQKKTVRKTKPIKTAPAKTIPPTPAPKPAPKPAPPKNNTNKTISGSAAQKAALAHAGVKASNAIGLRVSPDYDDGRFEYDVEFYANGYEYDYEIDGKSGRIISYDKDRDD